MTTDPVCGMTVYQSLAVACKDYKGEHFCFCSNDCREAFDNNPDLYANKPFRLME